MRQKKGLCTEVTGMGLGLPKIYSKIANHGINHFVCFDFFFLFLLTNA